MPRHSAVRQAELRRGLNEGSIKADCVTVLVLCGLGKQIGRLCKTGHAYPVGRQAESEGN
jgi:hypothetical protein